MLLVRLAEFVIVLLLALWVTRTCYRFIKKHWNEWLGKHNAEQWERDQKLICGICGEKVDPKGDVFIRYWYHEKCVRNLID